MITEEWKKFKGWMVLEYFLKTTRKIHIKALAKKLKISPYTANYYLKFYKKAHLLNEQKEGNLLFYFLVDNCLTRQLKIFYFLDLIFPHVLKFSKKNNVTSLVLYGSHASGTYDSTSDIDLLIISQQKKINFDELKKIEKETGKEIKIQVFSLGEWRSLKRKKDPFAQSILSNHILLFGSEL